MAEENIPAEVIKGNAEYELRYTKNGVNYSWYIESYVFENRNFAIPFIEALAKASGIKLEWKVEATK